MFYLELVIFMKDKTSESLRILGIDPGLNVTGYGIIDSIGDDVSSAQSVSLFIL